MASPVNYFEAKSVIEIDLGGSEYYEATVQQLSAYNRKLYIHTDLNRRLRNFQLPIEISDDVQDDEKFSWLFDGTTSQNDPTASSPDTSPPYPPPDLVDDEVVGRNWRNNLNNSEGGTVKFQNLLPSLIHKKYDPTQPTFPDSSSHIQNEGSFEDDVKQLLIDLFFYHGEESGAGANLKPSGVSEVKSTQFTSLITDRITPELFSDNQVKEICAVLRNGHKYTVMNKSGTAYDPDKAYEQTMRDGQLNLDNGDCVGIPIKLNAAASSSTLTFVLYFVQLTSQVEVLTKIGNKDQYQVFEDANTVKYGLTEENNNLEWLDASEVVLSTPPTVPVREVFDSLNTPYHPGVLGPFSNVNGGNTRVYGDFVKLNWYHDTNPYYHSTHDLEMTIRFTPDNVPLDFMIVGENWQIYPHYYDLLSGSDVAAILNTVSTSHNQTVTFRFQSTQARTVNAMGIIFTRLKPGKSYASINSMEVKFIDPNTPGPVLAAVNTIQSSPSQSGHPNTNILQSDANVWRGLPTGHYDTSSGLPLSEMKEYDVAGVMTPFQVNDVTFNVSNYTHHGVGHLYTHQLPLNYSTTPTNNDMFPV